MNSKLLSSDAPRLASARGRRFEGQAAFTLVELLVVVAILGILSAIAIPGFMTARRAAAEAAVVGQLRTMVTNQQLFYPNPVPLPPSSTTDRSPRFARLNELNGFSNGVFGTLNTLHFIDGPNVRYSMVPLVPTTDSLRGQFLIQAVELNLANGFIYEVDQSGNIVKIR